MAVLSSVGAWALLWDAAVLGSLHREQRAKVSHSFSQRKLEVSLCHRCLEKVFKDRSE